MATIAKTQISTLVNGSPNCIRATADTPIAGSTVAEREEIAEKVREENGDLNITCKGFDFTLKRHDSISGKTTYWYAEITPEQYKALTGLPACVKKNKEVAVTFMVQPNLNVQLQVYYRNNSNCKWRWQHSMYLDEAFVEIL